MMNRLATTGTAAALVLASTLAFTGEALAQAIVQRATEDHYVGSVTDDLFVGIGVAENPEDPTNRALAVYLCDGAGVFRWMFGVASADAVAFQAEDLRVSLDFTGGAIDGAVAFEGEEPAPFQVAEAVGDAGVYRSRDYVGGWIILNNEEQRGAVAFREQVVHPELNPAEGAVTVDGEIIVAERDLGLADCFPEPSGRCPVQ